MKKALSLILALVMCLSLCACGNGARRKTVEKQISQIGDVSLDNQEEIFAVLDSYNQLTDAEKEKVENYSKLKNAVDLLEEYQEIEEDLSALEDLIIKCDWEKAEQACLDLMKYVHLSEEQEQRVTSCGAFVSAVGVGMQGNLEAEEEVLLSLLDDEYLSEELKQLASICLGIIPEFCFAGTYIPLPEKVSSIEAKEIDGTTVEELISGETASISYYYKSEDELNTVFENYLEFLLNTFTLVQTMEDKNYTGYILCDSHGAVFGVSKTDNSAVRAGLYMMMITIFDEMFDYSKINSENPNAGIWQPAEAAIIEVH